MGKCPEEGKEVRSMLGLGEGQSDTRLLNSRLGP